jgi:hypothetical protein
MMIDALRDREEWLHASERKRRANAKTTAWAMVIESDYHLDNFMRMPCNEETLRVSPEAASDMYGGRINVSTSTGIFMAELQAIARVLFSLPVIFSITVITDSLSSINSIRTYLGEVNERKRLRMPGRPLLALISNNIHQRHAFSASTSFRHERSHTNLPTIESRGNAIADYWADTCRERTVNRMSNAIKDHFDLAKGERFVCLRDTSTRAVVSGDVRQTATATAAVRQLHEWIRSSSHGAFADEHVCDLSSRILAHGSQQQQCLLLLLLTNTIHLQKVKHERTSSLPSFSSSSASATELASTSTSKRFDMISTLCASCQCTASVAHLLLFCPAYSKKFV